MRSLYLIIILYSTQLIAQVGINNANPSATLDVIGDVKVDKNLFLENPTQFNQIKDSELLINTTENKIIQYDIAESKYGPINYAQYIFRNTSTYGLVNYDTKISIANYIVTIQGFYFLANGSTNVLLRSTLNNNNIEGFQFYAYPNTNTNTWFIKAVVNNSTFRSGTNFNENPIDLFLNVIIYRRGFITKTIPDKYVDMGNQETGTAPLPTGF